MKSPKEVALNKNILSRVEGKALTAAEYLISDPEIQALQDYANHVSIKRLGYTDHGPVHMKKVVLNAINMLDLLNAAGVKPNLEAEDLGTYEDSKIAVMMAAFLHDIGMSVGRQQHELVSTMLAKPIIERILAELYPDDLSKQITVKTLALEGILGHMATRALHSIEAGLILIADGCDMEKGRARIPSILNTESKVGDIHKYSSSAIESVQITKGETKPIKIKVLMSSSVGFFQIEEVLYPKISASTIKPYIELYAGVENEEMKCYL